MACPAGITDDDERKIWEVKSEALFDMLLAGAKPAIRQTIKAKIDEDEKNAAELWTAMETEFRIHAAETRMELLHRFATATIEDNNNVQQYISQFRDICSRLKHMGFEPAADIPKLRYVLLNVVVVFNGGSGKSVQELHSGFSGVDSEFSFHCCP